MIPSNLTRSGFDVSNPEDEKIDIESLTEIREFIRTNFEKIKTIVRKDNRTSHGLVIYLNPCLQRDFENGDFIAAMILEGFKYKQHSINCYFNISQESIKKLLSMWGETMKY